MNDLNMNRLPVPTWNQCGVNSAPKAAALPEIPGDDWGEANIAFTCPPGSAKPKTTSPPFRRAAWARPSIPTCWKMPPSAMR